MPILARLAEDRWIEDMTEILSLNTDQITPALLQRVLSELETARAELAKLYSSPNAELLRSQRSADGRMLFVQESDQIEALWKSVNMIGERIEQYQKVLQLSVTRLDEIDNSYINRVADWKMRLGYALKSGQEDWQDAVLEIPSLFLPAGVATAMVTVLGASNSGLIGQMASSLSTASGVLDDFTQRYENLPDELKDIAKTALGGDTIAAIQITRDLISGEADLETLEKFADSCLKTSIEGRAVSEVIDIVYHPSDNMRTLMDEHQYFSDLAVDSFSEGDILEGCKNAAVSMGVGLYTIGYGCVEIGYNMVNDIYCKGILIDFDEVTNFWANIWK